jgi:pyruvate/2-oxoglutarate dehydrogenase complex dihydrolipoamide dehydrogenase (E3) component
MPKHFDAIVIGAGQSGPSLAVRLAKAGNTVALVERRGLGGTCVNDGCIPTKTLIASARVAWLAREAERFGVSTGAVSVDMGKVKARKDAVVQQSRDGLQEWLEGTRGLTLVHGHARFEDPHRLRVGTEELTAARIFIDVGGRARVPEVLAGVPHLTNASMMDVDVLPEHLVVVGGSYVGLEFAQMYRRFGSRVTVLEQGPRIIAREDEDVAEEVRRILALEGIAIHTRTEVLEATAEAGTITLRTSGPEISGSHVLAAVGRVPNTHDLGLDRAGVRTDAHGYIEVDEQLRTSVEHIWALGDVNGRGAFTHTSYNDYEIVAENLLDGGSRRVTDRIPIYGLFVDPPLGRVGMNKQQARASGLEVSVGRLPMARVGRARERGETHGFIEILVDTDTQRVLGATILGIEGDEVVHVIADVMYADAPYTVISRAVHVHPTVSELLPTTLQQLEPLA